MTNLQRKKLHELQDRANEARQRFDKKVMEGKEVLFPSYGVDIYACYTQEEVDYINFKCSLPLPNPSEIGRD